MKGFCTNELTIYTVTNATKVKDFRALNNSVTCSLFGLLTTNCLIEEKMCHLKMKQT